MKYDILETSLQNRKKKDNDFAKATLGRRLQLFPLVEASLAECLEFTAEMVSAQAQAKPNQNHKTEED